MAANRPDNDALRTGWALKAHCYAAWNSDPAATVDAAQQLRALALARGGAELQALADWTAGIASLVRSRMVEALQSLDSASAGFSAIGQRLPAAHSRVPRLMALAVLGRFDEAEADALVTEQALRDAGDELAAARVRLNLGSLAYSRHCHHAAIRHYRLAAVRFARAGDREHSVMADIGIADASSSLGRFDDADTHYARAAMRAQAHALPVLAVSAAHGRAWLAMSRSDYAPALAGLEGARRSAAALGLAHRALEIEKNLADAYLELRLLPEALALYSALSATLAAGHELATLPWVQAQQARAMALAGQPAAALVALQAAEAGFSGQANAAGGATVRAVRAEIHHAGGRFAAARVDAAAAAEAFAAARLPLHAGAARLLQASATLSAGDAAAAAADCQALLEDPALPASLHAGARAEAAAALIALGRRDEGRVALEAAVEGIESLRGLLPGEELRRAFLAAAARPYRQRLSLALDAGDAADVLCWLERCKARALQERLGPADDVPAASPALRQQRARLDWIYRRQQHRLHDDGELPSQTLRDEALRLEHALLESARRDRLTAGATAATPGHQRPALRQSPTDRPLLVYGVADDELFAVIVGAAGPRLLRHVASFSAVAAAAKALRFQLDSVRAGAAWPAAQRAELVGRARRRLAALYALIWQPLAAALPRCERLIVVPHGVLHGVPFAALESSAGEALVERHEIVIAASAMVALQRPPAMASGNGTWLFGDSERLPHVATELVAVAALRPGAQVFGGAAASLAALRERAPTADVLHLACHARFRADNPLFSALDLADGALTAEQVQGLRLRARLVVLAACDSASGDAGPGDEGVGLVRAFLLAGAQAVLASPWAVDDAFGAAFMAAFHRRHAGGATAAEALRDSQRELRAAWPHPAHWAAFSLYGSSE